MKSYQHIEDVTLVGAHLEMRSDLVKRAYKRIVEESETESKYALGAFHGVCLAIGIGITISMIW